LENSEDNNSNLPKWATESIQIESPNHEWINRGNAEVKELLNLLSSFDVKEVEHIGSTSIFDLPAKPIIDLMAIVPSYDCIDDIAVKLGEYQWHFVPPELDNRPWRRFFIKVENQKRVAHLQAMLKGEPRWVQQLSFRNRLNRNPSLREEYATLKKDLAKKYFNDREAYSQAKTEFIQRVLEPKD
jgi:GrpB-like predicted nucleotidyltransferase (UPF0157 family)